MAQLACHMPLLGQRWPTGQNDVGPPVAANGGPTLAHRPTVAQRRSHRWPNVGPPGSCYLGSWRSDVILSIGPTSAQRRQTNRSVQRRQTNRSVQRRLNVGKPIGQSNVRRLNVGKPIGRSNVGSTSANQSVGPTATYGWTGQ